MLPWRPRALLLPRLQPWLCQGIPSGLLDFPVSGSYPKQSLPYGTSAVPTTAKGDLPEMYPTDTFPVGITGWNWVGAHSGGMG